MLGKTISHYKIRECIGQGGMGVVYKAEDTRLKRTVALKFLNPDLLQSASERLRFIREAQSAAALDHPNICTVYEIEEVNGHIFIAFQYIEGENLKERIAHGPLPVEEAVAIALQIAQGLQEAHKKGIVHRDIKSANIMITPQGQVKILDFGLAQGDGKTAFTPEGKSIGTPAYMSPEQIRRERVDARSDLWSLGVVFLEMLTGKLPFQGKNEHETMYAILMDELPLSPPGPPHLAKIIHQCLQKPVENRYQRVEEFIEDLQDVARHLTSNRRRKNRLLIWTATFTLILSAAGVTYFFLHPSLARARKPIPVVVADISNSTGEAELNSLSGLFIAALEPSPRLRVLPRTQLFDLLKQMGNDTLERIDAGTAARICRFAGIPLLVRSSVIRREDQFVITLTFIRVDDNQPIFTLQERSTGVEGIPSAIDRLAQKSRREFQENLDELNPGQPPVAQVTSTSLQAYRHYFQGEQLLNRLKIAAAEREFRKALALDSTFGLAYYRLAYTRSWQMGEEHLAKAPLQKAMALLQRIPRKERFLVRAEYARIQNGLQAYFKILQEMEKIYPDDKEMLFNIGDYYLHTRQPEKAEAYLRRVVRQDPTHGRALEHLARLYRDAQQYDRAMEFARRFLRVTESESAYFLLAEIYQKSGDLNGGIRALLKARAIYPENPNIDLSLTALYALQERFGPAEEQLLQLLKRNTPEARFWAHWGLTFFYPYLGRYREAERHCDWLIAYHRREQDSTAAAILQLYKALLKTWGWGDVAAGWKTAQSTERWQPGIDSYAYWLGWAVLALYRRDYPAAERVIREHQLFWLDPLLHAFRGKCGQARSELEKLNAEIPEYVRILTLFQTARCRFQQGRLAAAEKSLRQLQSLQDHSGGFRAVFYPRSIYWLGRIHEARGEQDRAREYYQKFLRIWQAADTDLPLLQEAQRRLKRLGEVSGAASSIIPGRAADAVKRWVEEAYPPNRSDKHQDGK